MPWKPVDPVAAHRSEWMRYLGTPEFRHSDPLRTGVLLVNLGTPDAPTPAALRRYLAEFLSDRRVIELPRLLWLSLLYGVILPLRAPRSAHAYAQVWQPEGSPLRLQSERLIAELKPSFTEDGVEIALAMRYGQPAVGSVLRAWQQRGLRRLLVLPLYPQYSGTTTASVFDAVMAELGRWRWLPELRWITEYHAEARWIDAVASSITEHWAQHGRAEKLLFSFHGLPQRYLRAGDPYFCHCHASARRIAATLGLGEADWQLSFQSRVGREVWLQPYTEAVVRELGRCGVQSLDVVCPGFAVDCLETLEEIAIRNAHDFAAAGGGALHYIPALNHAPRHVAFMTGLIRQHLAGWTHDDTRLGRSATHAAYQGPQR